MCIFPKHMYGVGKIKLARGKYISNIWIYMYKTDAEMTLTMQETVISMQQWVAVTCPRMRISRMLCPELRCVITFEWVRGADVFSGQLNATQNGPHDKRTRVHCRVLCEAQFMGKLYGTVCARVSDWTCFGKTSSKGCNTKRSGKMEWNGLCSE